MKKFILSLALICLLANRLQGGVILGTSNSAGTPLTAASGTTSGPMFVTIWSDNPPQDIMAAWNIQLEIVSISSTTGTLTFQDPATGTPSNPTNYIFGTGGLGIAAANNGNVLSANDFFDPTAGLGVAVPGGAGANLLELDFLSSSNASGLFGIYADQGAAHTQWTDNSFTTRYYTNVPDGTATILIGEVLVASPGTPVVPEPTSLALFCTGVSMFGGCKWLRNRKLRVTTTLEA